MLDSGHPVLHRFLPAFEATLTSVEPPSWWGKKSTKITVSAVVNEQGTLVTVQLASPLQMEMRQEETRIVLSFGENRVEFSRKDFHYEDSLIGSIDLDSSQGVNALSIQLKSKGIQTRLSHFEAQNVYLLQLRPQEISTGESKENPPPEPFQIPARKDTSKWEHLTIDAGHGGPDRGIVIKENLLEKDVTLAIGKKLRWALQSRLGINVELTRTEDQGLTLEERAAEANEPRSDLFVSLHIGNNNGGEEALSYAYTLKPSLLETGAEANPLKAVVEPLFVPWDQSQLRSLARSERLAEMIQQEMNRSLNGGNSSIRPRQAPLRLLMPLAMPAVMIEIGDASSTDFKEKVSRNAFQNLVAATISVAVEKFHAQQASP
ncbi:MAG: N-acetylmuramoyl-L-alanine amidase [Terriglobia bacterium]